tara:strand:+ start:1128 stop:1460 length:333 start_codon:yes stop_codon:yes gene_type:complete
VLTLQLLQLERMLALQFSEHLSLLLQRLIVVVVDIVALVSDAPFTRARSFQLRTAANEVLHLATWSARGSATSSVMPWRSHMWHGATPGVHVHPVSHERVYVVTAVASPS